MKVAFDKSFHKSLIKIKDRDILERVKNVILNVENATNLHGIPHIKKLEGFKSFYSIRIGDYRFGLELKKDTLWFIVIGDKKEVYRNFP